MLAKDVCISHKNRIRRIADKVRNPTITYIPQEKVFDKEDNIDILFTGSKSSVPDAFQMLNQITYELRGVHTHCRIIPLESKNINIICTEVNKKDAIELKNCLNPIKQQVADGLKNFGKEYLEIGKDAVTRKERREISKEAEKSGLFTPLLDIVEYYTRYKKEHCKPVEIKTSEIILKH